MSPEHTAFVASEFLRCKDWLQTALNHDYGTHALDDVWDLLKDGGPAQIWPLPNAVMVTVIEEFPRKKVLRGWLSGGDLREIQAHEPVIRAWAEKQGCDLVAISGRRGWVRAFDGYQEAATVSVRHIR